MNGRAHALASIVIAVPSGVAAASWTGDMATGLAVAGGCALGAMIGPDLDIDHRTEGERIAWRLGSGFGYAFQVWWYPYALLFKHRSPWTHLPLVGTLGRLLYVALTLSPLVALAWAGGWRPSADPLVRWYAVWALAGLAVSDAAHWLMDGLPV